jgi:hypothetical protein
MLVAWQQTDTGRTDRERVERSQCLLGRSLFVSLCKSSFKLILVGGFVVEGQVRNVYLTVTRVNQRLPEEIIVYIIVYIIVV